MEAFKSEASSKLIQLNEIRKEELQKRHYDKYRLNNLDQDKRQLEIALKSLSTFIESFDKEKMNFSSFIGKNRPPSTFYLN